MFHAAAEGGSIKAWNNLGLMYYEGNGVERDYGEAAIWYRKLAERGEGNAQAHLGYMYAMGLGVPKDKIKAYMWLTLAAARGEDDGRDFLARSMTMNQLAEAQDLADEWTPGEYSAK